MLLLFVSITNFTYLPIFQLVFIFLAAPHGEHQVHQTSEGDFLGGAECPGGAARQAVHDLSPVQGQGHHWGIPKD